MNSDLIIDGRLNRVRDLLWAGSDDRTLRRDAERGRVTKVLAGVYIATELWRALSDDERYLLRIAAVAGTRRGQVVFSHHSAAALLGYPVIGAWPVQVHTVVGSRSGLRSTPAIARHAVDVREDELVEVDGYVLTSPLRTARDIALVAPLAGAVTLLDRALASPPARAPHLPPVHREALLESLLRLGPARGTRRARFAAEFADAQAASPGESLSRVQLHRLRMPKPQLQVSVPKPTGGHWDVDFGWEEFALFGEFDGYFKYHREDMTRGQAPEDIVWAEKKREDAIRNTTKRSMTRWTWDIALSLPAFRRLLLEAGLRPTSARDTFPGRR